MHILVTNDDGPPSAAASPYILPFVAHLEAAGHTVSVVLPDTQRSWIAKAHIVGQDVRAVPFLPPAYRVPSPSTSSTAMAAGASVSSATKQSRPWYLVNSTPASCAQIGLHHLFAPDAAGNGSGAPQLPPVDMVVSGPNYGRNTTAVFALSSGTLGAALEAAVTGFKAVALSFAFFDRENDPEVVAESCRHSVRVVEWLHANGEWGAPSKVLQAGASAEAERRGNRGGIVFSVNVPVKKGVEKQRTVWTQLLQNAWSSSCFEEHRPEEDKGRRDEAPADVENEIRMGEVLGAKKEGNGADQGSDAGGVVDERHFKWSPRFTDVYESVRRAGEGSDGWAVSEGQTSVTMLRANFMHIEGFKGEVKL